MSNKFVEGFVDGIFNGTALKYKLIRGAFFASIVIWVIVFMWGLSLPVAGVIALASLDRILGINLWVQLKEWLQEENKGDTNDTART